ncbi:zona pellucida protein AX 2 isoform X1 [Megalobrama amblycephala]|uniref:zona pellucida protein AX 2 isoform X1 n=2 Tax=Megalobrama amblycephala TaxID=75352 RepID=UPI002013D8C5|nr:zona pellucida protein AX 2 isoform X1 [Megalobrama amblycephala]
MGCFEIGAFWLMVTIISVDADTSAGGIQAECLGNRVQFTLPSSLSAGGPLEVYAVNNTQTVLLTPHLAAQCGYTQKSDPWGNTIVSASLKNCFAEIKGDQEFKVAIQVKLDEFSMLSEKVYEAFKSCSHTLVSREILCETNFMEVSVRNAIPEIKKAPVKEWPAVIPNLQLWKILLYTPEEKAFDKETLQGMGYSVYSSPTRLVLRSPYNMAETFVQNVDDVDMMVFKSVVLFRDRWMLAIVESAAACPTDGASVVGEMIYWRFPINITPLVSSEVDILEVHMGINGRRLTPEEMNSLNFGMTFTESHVVVEIPVGAPGGYYKSHALENHLHISYSIEPMLELLWKEGLDKTTYKVLFPITTPLTPWPPQIIDNTQPKKKIFDILLGYFLPDVELLNITFGSELLTVSEIIITGLVLQEQSFLNGTKAFNLQVPFSEPYVQVKIFRPDRRTYILPLVFGFIILPEHASFSHPAVLQVSLNDTVLPNAGGICIEDIFNIHIKYGSTPRSQLKIKLGQVELNDNVLQQYEHHSNETHFNIVVPFLAPLVAIESVQSTGVTGRIDVEIYDTLNDLLVKDFSLACPFFVKMSECFSNGTITVVLPKLESLKRLAPGELSLRDPACKPHYNEDHFAYFRFDVTTCGTTRKFVEDTMIYENEFTWKSDEPLLQISESHSEAEYRFTVSCIYTANATQSMIFHAVSPLREPEADVGKGELTVSLRLSQDMVYRLFYHDGDYPVLKFLKQPLYFEVGMDHSRDSRLAVTLENCWATLTKDRESKPRWDLIVDGCPNPKDPERTVFHPVIEDDRVDIPDHFKRFEVKTFTFTEDDGSSENEGDNMARRVFVHCDVVICHVENIADGRCYKQCAATQNTIGSSSNRVLRSSSFSEEALEHVSIGPILLI